MGGVAENDPGQLQKVFERYLSWLSGSRNSGVQLCERFGDEVGEFLQVKDHNAVVGAFKSDLQVFDC